MPPMLPPAEKNQDDFAGGKPGVWHKRVWPDLENIASRTRNTADIKNKIDVDLIPDIWARHILFANALYDEGHLLHKDAVAAFRGFLALLALRSRKSILMKAEELRLDAAGNWPFALAARNFATRSSRGIHQLYADTGWNEIYLLRGEGRSLLGVTSPLTLICPAQGPATTGLKNLPGAWFDGGRFRDPSVQGVLNDADRGLLQAWLQQLRAKLADHGEKEGALSWPHGHNLLLSAISTFETELSQNAPAKAPATQDILRMGSSAYSFLAAALSPEDIRLEHSDLLLDSSAKVLLPFRASDKEVSFEPPTDPSRITVVTGTSVLDINTVVWGDTKRILAGHALPEDAEWLDPKTLFLDRLYLLKGTQQKSGMNHAKGQREVADQLSYYPLMPFAQRLLDLLPPDQIVKSVRFSIEDQGSGNVVVVKLRLPLRGGKVLEVTHGYDTEKQSSIDQIPVLEVWPPFRKPDWKFYNTFYWTNSDNAFAAEPFPVANRSLKEQTENIAGNQIRVTPLNGPPEGFLVRVPHPLRGRSDPQPAGIIFNKLVEITEPPKGTWAAGVDFGTSSTHIVLKAGKGGGEDPLRLVQSGPLRVVVGRDADRAPSLYQYFLPFNPDSEVQPEISPFLSFLRMRHPEETAFDAISGAHVLFYSPSHNIQELSAGRLATNLKWEGESKSRSRPYLQQICLQASAEAALAGAQGMDWFYSLPAAFSLHKQKEYEREWTAICEFISEQTGLRPTAGQGPANMTESFATARYFKEREKAPPEKGAIFLDIGGGTTDISIWQANQEKCEVSIRFAGRDMFLGPLFEVRERLLPEFARIYPEKVSQATVNRLLGDQSERDFFAHAEAMLRDAGIKLPQKLHDQDRLEAAALPLRFGIAGLFYYVGLILQHLESTGQFKKDLGGVYIGGNGSQLLHWADGGKYSHSGSLAPILTGSLFAGAGWTNDAPRNVLIKLSAKPKQEAATGLVVESGLKSGAKHWNDVIPGEPFTFGTEPKTEIDLVSRETLRNAKLTRLPQLERFYDNYVKLAESIGYPRINQKKDELFARAEERVRQFLADEKDKAVEDLDSTPPFIKGLQALTIGVARETDQSLGASSGR